MSELIIEEETNKEVWNSFIHKHSNETFHQSWEWGNLYEQLGDRVWRFSVRDSGEVLAQALVIRISARRGLFLHVPHGPIFAKQTNIKESLRSLAQHLITLAREQGCSFVRVAPILKRNNLNADIFKSLGFRRAPIFIQSELSWRLDISKDEAELLSGMRKSTRYILKRKGKFPVEYKKSQDVSDFEEFYKLYKGTVEQKGFFGQSKKFIKSEFESFLQSNSATLYFAYVDGLLLSSALVLHQEKSGYYHWGASIRSKVPAPHLLQWYIINDLKAQGYTYYNFWGISPDNKPKHPWRGLTVFKKGFGGEELEYLQTHDYVLKWTYWINWAIETTRRIKRHY